LQPDQSLLESGRRCDSVQGVRVAEQHLGGADADQYDIHVVHRTRGIDYVLLRGGGLRWWGVVRAESVRERDDAVVCRDDDHDRRNVDDHDDESDGRWWCLSLGAGVRVERRRWWAGDGHRQ